MNLPHHSVDIASEGFQRLEDLASSYWYSEVLFASLELNIFGLLADGPLTVDLLAEKAGYDRDGLARFLDVLAALGLLVSYEGSFSNGPLASRFLTPESSEYLGDFLLYRRYLGQHWKRLGKRIREGRAANDRSADEAPESFRERTLAYVKVLDIQARLKSFESVELLKNIFNSVPARLLDVAGGAGAWCRAFRRQWPNLDTVLLELPDTIAAARTLYPAPEAWDGIQVVAGSALESCVAEKKFDLILFSNILHAYGPLEAEQILREFSSCLAPGGTVLVHDYLSDLHDSDPVKGALYDLHMLVNTYNGRVFKVNDVISMLNRAGFGSVRFFHLKSDTSVFLATPGEPAENRRLPWPAMLEAQARNSGFSFARVIKASDIAVKPWVRMKCRFGCSLYGQSICCPPVSMSGQEMSSLLSGYAHALLVQGSPPSDLFHRQLLDLERSLFLGGYPEALAFGAGPCPVCPSCPMEGGCRFPEKARPSLEACGVDVYETAHRAGISLNPVLHRQGYVKYVGLVLFDKVGKDAGPAGPGSLHA